MKRVKKITWWQRMLCRLLCPRFREDRPTEDKPGDWVAASIKVRLLNRRDEVETAVVTGLFNAYEVSRWLALKLDWRLHPDLGVDWGVRKMTQDEQTA